MVICKPINQLSINNARSSINCKLQPSVFQNEDIFNISSICGWSKGETNEFNCDEVYIQGCLANSYDGNRQKVVRISPLVRISHTM